MGRTGGREGGAPPQSLTPMSKPSVRQMELNCGGEKSLRASLLPIVVYSQLSLIQISKEIHNMLIPPPQEEIGKILFVCLSLPPSV